MSAANHPPQGGCLPKDYAKLAHDKQRLGELIDVNRQRIELTAASEGEGLSAKSQIAPWDLLARCNEYFLTALPQRGKNGGQFLHASCVVALPGGDAGALQGRIYEPLLRLRAGPWSCRSGSSGKPRRPALARHFIYGQESNATTAPAGSETCPARHRGLTSAPSNADSFRPDNSPDLRPDYVIAQSALQTTSDCSARTIDVRWQYGVPRRANAPLRLGAALHPHRRPAAIGRLRARPNGA